MSKLQTIPGIGPSSIELLEAAGFLDEVSLAKAGVDSLVKELEKANSILKIADQAPTRDEVESWLFSAREKAGLSARTESVADAPLEAVNYEGNPDVGKLLDKAPVALPLPAKQLVGKQLAVADIPSAILLNRVVGDLDVRISDSTPAASKPEIRTIGGGGQTVEVSPQPQRRELDAARVRAIAKPVAEETPSGEPDRVSLIRSPRPETNRGRNPESRFFIRGVLHMHRFQVLFGAVVTLIVIVVLPLAVIAAGLLLMRDLNPASFSWVPPWILAFPLALPIAGIAYLIWGVGAGKCRVCGQRLFVPKACRKNAKAHHVPVLGYIIPTALHMLVFRWFRCTYCGTPVRLKE